MVSTDLPERSAGLGPQSPGGGWSRFAPGIRGQGTAARRAWQPAYVRRAVLLDVVCAAVAAVAGYHLWFDWTDASAAHPPIVTALALPLVWLPALLIARTYEKRFLWVGVEEYRRIFAAAVSLLAAVGTVS